MTVGDRDVVRDRDREEPDGRAVPEGIVAEAAVCVALGAALRTWGLGGHDLTFDEAFTGAATARGLGGVFSYLRSSDAHPPLDYLLRAPLAGAGDEALLLRLPSTVWSLGTLLASLAHSAALVPLGCLMVLRGMRRDADVWFLRISLVEAAAVWAPFWGPAFKDDILVAGVDREGRFSIVDPSAPRSCRTHLLDHARLPRDVAAERGTTVCAPRLETYSWILRCRKEGS